MIPFPCQLSGAQFLAERQFALLADEPRCGKTGAALMGADYELADTILIVTTASGRAVWRKAIKNWSNVRRSLVRIISWGEVLNSRTFVELISRTWDLLILDESHYASSLEAKRTQLVFGVHGKALYQLARRTWCLTGTPITNWPHKLYPMMRALFPDRLLAYDGMPDVSDYEDFFNRYCKWRPKKLPRGFRSIRVVIEGKNLDELHRRLDGVYLRRTQKDVGITEPIYETFPLECSVSVRKQIAQIPEANDLLDAIEAEDDISSGYDLGPLRRITGTIKAHAIVEAIKEEFECGLEQIVIMAWHKDTLRILEAGLGAYNPITLDGSTSATRRACAQEEFASGRSKVFLGQIQAAGEAIDLSASAELLFAETSLIAKDMKQASLRITNHGQTRIPRVRVAVLENSIDEKIETMLMRQWAAIREVLA